MARTKLSVSWKYDPRQAIASEWVEDEVNQALE
jgi:hypothetical protein